MFRQVDFSIFRVYSVSMEKRQQKITFTENKKAFFDYEIIEEYEAGIKLL